jgi:hypothetical protein
MPSIKLQSVFIDSSEGIKVKPISADELIGKYVLCKKCTK